MMPTPVPSPSPPEATKSSYVVPSLANRKRHVVASEPVPGHGGVSHSATSYANHRAVPCANFHPPDALAQNTPHENNSPG